MSIMNVVSSIQRSREYLQEEKYSTPERGGEESESESKHNYCQPMDV